MYRSSDATSIGCLTMPAIVKIFYVIVRRIRESENQGGRSGNILKGSCLVRVSGREVVGLPRPRLVLAFNRKLPIAGMG